MKTVSISEARKSLPALAEQVARTREAILITRHGAPLAQLTPVDTPQTLDARYPLRGLPIVIADDFDAPLEEHWEALEP